MFARIARGADRKRAVFETGRRKFEREATLLIYEDMEGQIN
jgi:hypothetical protein